MAEEGQISSKKVTLILIAIYLFTLFLSLYVINNNFSIYHHELRNLALSSEITSLETFFSGFYPNIPYLFPRMLFNFLQPSLEVALIQNHILLAIFIISSYTLTKKLFNKKTGLLTVFISTSIPLFFGFYRTFSHKFFGIAFLPLLTLFLMKTDNFTNKKENIKFIILVFLLLNFAEYSAIYVLALIIFQLSYIILKKPYRPIDILSENKLNIILISLLAPITAYLTGYDRIKGMICLDRSLSWQVCLFEILKLDINYLTQNVYRLGVQFLPVLIFIFIPSILVFTYRFYKKPEYKKGLVLSLIILPLLIHSYFFGEQPSIHLLPVIFPLSITVAHIYDTVSQKIRKNSKLAAKVVLVLFVSVFLINNILISINANFYTPESLDDEGRHYKNEIRYFKSNDYQRTFSKLNSVKEPTVGRILDSSVKDSSPKNWPAFKNRYEHHLNLFSTGFIPEETNFITLKLPEKQITKLDRLNNTEIDNKDLRYVIRKSDVLAYIRKENQGSIDEKYFNKFKVLEKLHYDGIKTTLFEMD